MPPTAAAPKPPSPWLTLTRGKIQLLVVVGIFMLCGGLGTVMIGIVQATAHRMSCNNNLRQIGLAIQHYEAT